MSQSFQRGIAILDLFSKNRTHITLPEIAVELNISEITAYRYVRVLADQGFLLVDSKHIKISAKILRFTNIFWQQNELISLANETLSNLQADLKETIALCQLEGHDVICIHRIESSMALRSTFNIGQKMSIHAGAFARTISAFLTESELNNIMSFIKWDSFTEHTISNPTEYLNRLALIRENEYDISFEEVREGTVAIAVPILLENKIIASLGLSMPTLRYNEHNLEALAQKLKDAASNIQNKISKYPYYQ